MQVIEPPWSDADVDALRQRNAERVRVAIEQLGPAWVLYKGPVTLRPVPFDLVYDALRRPDRLYGMCRIDRAVNSVQHSRP